MVDNKGDTSKQQQPPQEASPKDPLEESSSETRQQLHHHHHRHQYSQQQPPPPPPPLPVAVVVTGGPFVSPPIFVPTTSSSSPFEQQKQFETVNPKRPRYGNTGQWKLLPSPSSQQQKNKQTQMAILSTETSPQSKPQPQQQPQPQPQQQTPPDSSSNTVSTSSKSARTNSPIPSLSAASGQDTNKPTESEDQQILHHQLRRGKYVSPVWKPNEMLWLARAWRLQYQGSGGDGGDGTDMATQQQLQPSSKGKTRADKDREVAEYLNRHGVKRDAKTAGTKWDNMLGEFRKVYEWERGSDRISSSSSFGERERSEQPQQLQQGGKSYFRLSPYERKLHRLPASFDEEVFDELSQFMGSRMRTSPMQSRGGGDQDGSSRGVFGGVSKTLALPAPPLRDDDLSLPGIPCAVRAKQLAMASGGEAYFHGGGNRGNVLGFDTTAQDMTNPSSSKDHHQLRRIGKIRMIWEESVTLWGDQQQQQHHHNQEGGGGGGQGSSSSRSVGRVKLQGSSFLNADELTFFDESMVACSLEAFEDGPYKGFSVDKFLSGQQVKVFGRKKSSSSSAPTSSGFTERFQLPLAETSSIRSTPPWEFQDPTEYYVGCLRVPPATLPSLFELSWHLQEPPPEEFRFPLRRDVYRDLPQGKELFFSTSTEPLDCRAITYDILSPIFRPTPSISGATATSRDSFIGLWDDCINRIVSKFCSVEMVLIRKPSSSISADSLQDEWPNVTGFVRNFCLWRGEETDQLRNGHSDPSTSIIAKLLWSYTDLPYILGYYAVGYIVTFCALSRSQDRVIRTDLYSLDLSAPTDRLKALISCWRIAGLLPLLADRCFNNINSNNNFKTFTYSDFERIDSGNGNIVEMTPNTMTRFFSSKRKWAAVKEIYDFLDHRIPHAEQIVRSSEKDLALVFKPRGCRTKPTSTEQLIEALKYVTKALVALHDLSFMHRDLGWDKVMRRSESTENEWFVCGFDEAVGAPQIYPHGGGGGGGGGGSGGTTVVGVTAASGRHAPEMGRGLHGVKVDVWGVGQLVRTCGLVTVPKLLRELQNRCLDQNPEQRPTAADCYHHLLQLQSSLSASAGGY